MEDFPKRLREARKRKGMSQEKLARKIDVSLGTVENWENGRTKPGFDQFLRLAEELEWQVDFRCFAQVAV